MCCNRPIEFPMGYGYMTLDEIYKLYEERGFVFVGNNGEFRFIGKEDK